MQFRLMLRGRGYIGAAGRSQPFDAADDPTGELSHPIYYFSESRGILESLFNKGKGIHRGFISQQKYDELSSMGVVLMDSKRQLENFGMGNYALFRVRGQGR